MNLNKMNLDEMKVLEKFFKEITVLKPNEDQVFCIKTNKNLPILHYKKIQKYWNNVWKSIDRKPPPLMFLENMEIILMEGR